MTNIAPNSNLQTLAQNVSVSQNSAQSTPAPNLNADNALEKTPKSDTITFAGKTIKKKSAIIGGLGILAAATAVGAAIYLKVRSGKTPSEISAMIENSEQAKIAAEGMVKKADELAQTVQKKIDAVVELFNNGGKNAEGQVVATIKDGFLANEKVMEEIVEDGTKRVSKFENGILNAIDELLEDGKGNKITFDNGKPRSYREGIETLSDGTTKVAKNIRFNNGKPYSYSEGCELLKGGASKTDKYLEFRDSKPTFYSEAYERLADRTRKATKDICFVSGEIDSYCEGYEHLAGGTLKAAKEICFDNGKPTSYLEGSEFNVSDGTTKAVKSFKFVKNKWCEATQK